jgi:hypothetical protein
VWDELKEGVEPGVAKAATGKPYEPCGNPVPKDRVKRFMPAPQARRPHQRRTGASCSICSPAACSVRGPGIGAGFGIGVVASRYAADA